MFYYNIPMNETDIQELKGAKMLLKGKIPLYFALVTDMIDNIYITDYKSDNLHIGEIVIDHKNNAYNIFIFDDLPLANMAIELLDQMIEQNLVEKQSRLQFGVYDDEDESSFGILTLKVGVLGEFQEDFYAAYFLGSTIRPYGYDREDYYTNNYTEEELLGYTDTDLAYNNSKNPSFFSRLFNKILGRK